MQNGHTTHYFVFHSMPIVSPFSFQHSVLQLALPLSQSAQDSHRGMQRDVLDAYNYFIKFSEIEILFELPSFDLDDVEGANPNEKIKLRDQMQIKAAENAKA